MNKRWVLIGGVVVLAGGIATYKFLKKNDAKEKSAVAKSLANSYWTCPMHPQIHWDHPGECPICHMKLVQVKATQAVAAEAEARTAVDVTKQQLVLTGTQRSTVEKMDLKVKIPVSGRYISSGSVAFQIYESDLRYVKPGLAFHGASSFYPEEELAGVISSVDSIVDPTSRTVRVVGSIRNGGRGVPSETAFRGDIEFTLSDRVALPESSILHTGSGDYVYLFTSESRVVPRKVKLGLKTEGFYDVLDGVQPGEVISAGPNFLLDSESKIRASGAQ